MSRQVDHGFRWTVFREQEDLSIKHFPCDLRDRVRLAIEAMKHAAREYQPVYPETARYIELDTYVDDFLSCARNVQQATMLNNYVIEILESW